MSGLKPFWRYYGGKWRAAPRYPAPLYKTIVEPFAGAAGYSCRQPDRNVILIDADPCIAGIWNYLIRVPSAEIRAIPHVEAVDDLPAWVPQPARDLVGFWMNAACVAPCRTLSSGRKKMASMGRNFEGWTEATRELIASQVERIRHWHVFCGSYSQIETKEPATWFVDPPYNNKAGSYYVHGPRAIDYKHLGQWCQERKGQVLVCENEGADWLPFEPFRVFRQSINGSGSREVLWQRLDTHHATS